ncbi:hypothetical protein E2C01_049806 [Portunus trituberculatus]|uniref:Uncharacterized protein n=1 Tax=Portunus trituberculatus TaxID=210409 RepID=A0A5B7G7C8_PORTR|nr:hypothetical protein [Portunus trituberculatus]
METVVAVVEVVMEEEEEEEEEAVRVGGTGPCLYLQAETFCLKFPQFPPPPLRLPAAHRRQPHLLAPAYLHLDSPPRWSPRVEIRRLLIIVVRRF